MPATSAPKLEGHGVRRVIAITVGVAVAVVAAVVIYQLIFAGIHRELVRSGETSHMWWMIAVAAIVFGSGGRALAMALLERRARRAAEDARLPRAKIES